MALALVLVTASAVVADVIDIVRDISYTEDGAGTIPQLAFEALTNMPILSRDEMTTGYYIRLEMLKIKQAYWLMTNTDSAVLPRVELSQERLETVELLPFRAAILAKTDSIMVAHVSYPWDSRINLPASFITLHRHRYFAQRVELYRTNHHGCHEYESYQQLISLRCSGKETAFRPESTSSSCRRIFPPLMRR